MEHSSERQALEQALLAVWQQVMIENRANVELEGQSYPVGIVGSKRLRKVEFRAAGRDMTGIEQNPRTTSKWAQMARHGARVMQFQDGGRYVANVADGK